jgi:hypothetical protein
MTPTGKQTHTTAYLAHTTSPMQTTPAQCKSKACLASPKYTKTQYKPTIQKSNKFSENYFSENVNFCTPRAFKIPIGTSLQKLNTKKNSPFFHPFFIKINQKRPKNAVFLPKSTQNCSINKIQQMAKKWHILHESALPSRILHYIFTTK